MFIFVFLYLIDRKYSTIENLVLNYDQTGLIVFDKKIFPEHFLVKEYHSNFIFKMKFSYINCGKRKPLLHSEPFQNSKNFCFI